MPATRKPPTPEARGSAMLRAYESRFLRDEPLGMEDAAPRLIMDILARCMEEETAKPGGETSVHPRDILLHVIERAERRFGFSLDKPSASG